jgi:formylglycine-generating enzyme required for sulfatase activity
MRQFLTLLKQIDLDLDAEAIADALWLASQIDPSEISGSEPSQPAAAGVVERREVYNHRPLPPATDLPEHQEAIVIPPLRDDPSSPSSSLPFQAPAAPALRNPLELGRSLRPLMRKVPSRTEQILDEEATAIQIAESAGKRQWVPIFQPAPERWLDLALVIEESHSTVIWQELITEFQTLLERQGAFRRIRIWSLQTDESRRTALFLRSSKLSEPPCPRSPRELLDPSGRQLILLLSDCVSQLWRQGNLYPLLKQWSSVEPTAIAQFLPERLWTRSTLGLGLPVQLSAFVPGVANSQLEVTDLPVWETVNLSTALTLPVITLEPESLGQWARVVSGMGKAQTVGMVFDLAFVGAQSQPIPSVDRTQLTPEEILQRFRSTASPMARRLAGLMSLVPVSLPIIHLIQEAVLPASRQVHVAEVLMSGLLEPQAAQAQSKQRRSKQRQSKPVQYEFVTGVREQLQRSVSKTDALMVLDKISQYIAERAGLSIRSFAALLVLAAERGTEVGADVQQFAKLSVDVLRRMGGEYAAFVDEIAKAAAMRADHRPLPRLQPFRFEVATIEMEAARETLQQFEFELVTVTVQRRRLFRRTTELVQTRSRRLAYYFSEMLGDGLRLDMVAIPEGSFLMGAPEKESEGSRDERPQHRVTLPAFFMGKYPVTQSQWRVVAAMPPIHRELAPDPSMFKGENHPVENIFWLDAVEFCDRLSHHTGRRYHLPSEAEWEYACRAGTTTPFHFGEIITPDLANYAWSEPYGTIEITQKKDFQGTTPVGNFGIANAFGLYDMHGNVWEWCQDHWHDTYASAPADGSAWIDPGAVTGDKRLLRGGSWFIDPGFCRSARRIFSFSGVRDNSVGLRVVCSI